jgi:hypothetical protein
MKPGRPRKRRHKRRSANENNAAVVEAKSAAEREG